MDIGSIAELVSLGISAVALLVASIKGHKKKECTIEELQEEVQAKTKKYYEKQCKKSGLTIENKEE